MATPEAGQKHRRLNRKPATTERPILFGNQVERQIVEAAKFGKCPQIVIEQRRGELCACFRHAP